MPRTEISDIQLRDNEGKATNGRLFTTIYDRGDRTRRALLRLGGFWAVAGVSVFIPIAHVVLVPGFIIAGLVVAVMAYRSTQARDHAEGECPVCRESITIGLEAKDEIPKWAYCPACNTSLQITEPG